MRHRVPWKLAGEALLAVLLLASMVVGVLLALQPSGATYLRILRYRDSGIEDFAIFPSRRVAASAKPFHLRDETAQGRVPHKVTLFSSEPQALDGLLDDNGTVAFLVARDDVLLYEHYFHGHTRASPSLVFSVSKSLLSLLVGIAVADGRLPPIDTPVTRLVPELASAGYGAVTLEHLLQQTSGMDYEESDNPFSLHPHMYYGDNLEPRLLRLGLREQPGTHFAYASGNAELMGLALSRALRPQSISAYFQQRVWGPIGAEYDAAWAVDHEGGLEKTFCCFSARAIDLVKIGLLYLHGGAWQGRQLVPNQWVARSTREGERDGSVWYYQLGWWRLTPGDPAFAAVGHLGQYVFVFPAQRIVIVRLGHDHGRLSTQDWGQLARYVAAHTR